MIKKEIKPINYTSDEDYYIITGIPPRRNLTELKNMSLEEKSEYMQNMKNAYLISSVLESNINLAKEDILVAFLKTPIGSSLKVNNRYLHQDETGILIITLKEGVEVIE